MKTHEFQCTLRPEVAAYAARYLSRHSLEQKCSNCPFTVRVTLAPVET